MLTDEQQCEWKDACDKFIGCSRLLVATELQIITIGVDSELQEAMNNNCQIAARAGVQLIATHRKLYPQLYLDETDAEPQLFSVPRASA